MTVGVPYSSHRLCLTVHCYLRLNWQIPDFCKLPTEPKCCENTEDSTGSKSAESKGTSLLSSVTSGTLFPAVTLTHLLEYMLTLKHIFVHFHSPTLRQCSLNPFFLLTSINILFPPVLTTQVSILLTLLTSGCCVIVHGCDLFLFPMCQDIRRRSSCVFP